MGSKGALWEKERESASRPWIHHQDKQVCPSLFIASDTGSKITKHNTHTHNRLQVKPLMVKWTQSNRDGPKGKLLSQLIKPGQQMVWTWIQECVCVCPLISTVAARTTTAGVNYSRLTNLTTLDHWSEWCENSLLTHSFSWFNGQTHVLNPNGVANSIEQMEYT